MSFRFEKKALFHFSDYNNLKNLIFNLKGSILYPKRKIESLYFDNYNYQAFTDSEEGVLPRKKIRIRNYPNNKKKKFFLEKKISSVEGRFKLSSLLTSLNYNSFINFGIYDDQYGLCLPNLRITYEREYFTMLNHRITIDRNMNYKKYNSYYNFFDNENIILEVKSNIFDNRNLFDHLPQFNETRFSKYCSSIKKIIKKNIT